MAIRAKRHRARLLSAANHRQSGRVANLPFQGSHSFRPNVGSALHLDLANGQLASGPRRD